MRMFKDGGGNEWHVGVTVIDLEQIRTRSGIDLTKLFEMVDDGWKNLAQFLNNYWGIGLVLQTLCGPQISERNLTDEAFLCLLQGDTLEAATDAIVLSVIDFLPGAERRQALHTAWQSLKQTEAAVMGAATPVFLQALDEAGRQLTASVTAIPPADQKHDDLPV